MSGDKINTKRKCYKARSQSTKVRKLLHTLEENRVLAKFRPPINGYLLWFLAGVYNVSLNINVNASLTENLFVMLRHLTAAGIGVYALARLYFIFVETTFRQILWYMLIITAAFNFGTFIEVSSAFVQSYLFRF